WQIFGLSLARPGCQAPFSYADAVRTVFKVSEAASSEGGIDDRVHLLQQHIGSVLLSLGDGDLDSIAQCEHLPALVPLVCTDVLVTLPCPLGNVGEECVHLLLGIL